LVSAVTLISVPVVVPAIGEIIFPQEPVIGSEDFKLTPYCTATRTRQAINIIRIGDRLDFLLLGFFLFASDASGLLLVGV
jgi:hypothetical protein